MYRIDFEYYNKSIGMDAQDSFEIEDNNFNNFLMWIEDHDITNYKITNIDVYED